MHAYTLSYSASFFLIDVGNGFYYLHNSFLFFFMSVMVDLELLSYAVG